MRLIYHIIPGVEPRASLSGTAAGGDSVPGSTPLTVWVGGVPRGVQ